mmetsp:Transcript_6333/g.9887  ORF Transcript_6333/g.9887 Transcript_6333/m.9887 type:complete len:378 (-) Transcript_6333:405-1538(-)
MDSYLKDLLGNSAHGSSSIHIVDDNVTTKLDSQDVNKLLSRSYHGTDGRRSSMPSSSSSSSMTTTRRRRAWNRSSSMEDQSTVATMWTSSSKQPPCRWESLIESTLPRRRSDSALGKPKRRSSESEDIDGSENLSVLSSPSFRKMLLEEVGGDGLMSPSSPPLTREHGNSKNATYFRNEPLAVSSSTISRLVRPSRDLIDLDKHKTAEGFRNTNEQKQHKQPEDDDSLDSFHSSDDPKDDEEEINMGKSYVVPLKTSASPPADVIRRKPNHHKRCTAGPPEKPERRFSDDSVTMFVSSDTTPPVKGEIAKFHDRQEIRAACRAKRLSSSPDHSSPSLSSSCLEFPDSLRELPYETESSTSNCCLSPSSMQQEVDGSM